MKKLALAALLAASLASPAMADDAETPRSLGGVYGGSYLCDDGEHGFYLDLHTVTEMEAGWGVIGTLGFYPTLAGEEDGAADVAGSFQVTGMVGKTLRIGLVPGAWEVYAPGYGAAQLDAQLELGENGLWKMTGKPVVPGAPDMCSALIATQFLPATDD